MTTVAELAIRLHCTERHVRRMIADGLISVEMSLDEATGALLRDLRDKVKVRTSKGSPLEEARSKALHIDIEKKRLELAELQGQLVRIDVCREEWRSTCINIRTKLLTAPNRCAALVSPDIAPLVQETVKGVVHETLRELARGGDAGQGAARARPRRDSRGARGSRSASA